MSTSLNVSKVLMYLDTYFESSIHDVVTCEGGEADLARLRLLWPSSSICSNCFSSNIIPTMVTLVRFPHHRCCSTIVLFYYTTCQEVKRAQLKCNTKTTIYSSYFPVLACFTQISNELHSSTTMEISLLIFLLILKKQKRLETTHFAFCKIS